MEEVTHLKIKYNDDVRRFSVSNSMCFNDLYKFVCQKLEVNQEITLKYVDDEEEFITIGSDLELEEAKRIQPKVLRLEVFSLNENKTSSSSTIIKKEEKEKEEKEKENNNNNNINVKQLFSCCLIKDLSIPDGSHVSPNTPFKKMWRIKNDGESTWPSSCSLVLASDNCEFGGSVEGVSLGREIEKGQIVDIGFNLVSPQKEGRYASYWRLSYGGQCFGPRIGVDVVVVVSPEKKKQEEQELECKLINYKYLEEKKQKEEIQRKEEEEERKRAALIEKARLLQEQLLQEKMQKELVKKKVQAEKEAMEKALEAEKEVMKKAEDKAKALKEKALREAEQKAIEAEQKALREAEQKALREAEQKAIEAEQKAIEAELEEEEKAQRKMEEAERKKKAENAIIQNSRYRAQLLELCAMGFTDLEANEAVLSACKGDMTQALETLL